MKTQFIRRFSVALLAAVSLYAQGSQKLVVQVPFEFHVGNSMLPAGQYTVFTDAGAPVLRLRSYDSKSSVMILTNAVQTSIEPSQGKLVFHRYGDEYFLSQIWQAGVNAGRELPKSRREIEVAANARRGTEAIMARK